jgi:hypothetical protein
MDLTKLNIVELVKLRTKLLLEGKDTSELNILIDNKESEYIKLINEEEDDAGSVGSIGVSLNGGGMGPVISSQPSNYAGVACEPGYSDGGGTIGSGDVSAPYHLNGHKTFQKVPLDNRKGNSKRRKNKILSGLKNTIANRKDFLSGQDKDRPKKVMNFNDFNKEDINKVTKVKQ